MKWENKQNEKSSMRLRQKDGIEVMELNVQIDHVQLVVWIAPKYAIASVMGYLKGKLAIGLFQRYERLGRSDYGAEICGVEDIVSAQSASTKNRSANM